MKSFIGFVLLFFTITLTRAQPYGNEWIDYTQKYYKFPIHKTGIYRIDYNTLLNGLGAIPHPKSLKIFGHGQELYIHVEGEGDGVFNNSDYIEFYAEKNDGWFDSLLYVTPKEQTNPFYSNFTDTAYYYLTYGPSLDGKRLFNDLSTVFPPTSAPYFLKEEVLYYTDQYYPGKYSEVYSPYYAIGEGWMKSSFAGGETVTVNLNTPNVYTGGPSMATVKTLYGGTNANSKHMRLKYGISGILVLDTTFGDYYKIRRSFTIPVSDITSTFPITYELVYDNDISASIAYTYIKFPHTYNLEDKTEYTMGIPYTGISPTYFKAYNFSAQQAHYLYDLTDHRRIKTVQNADTVKALIVASNTGQEKKCYLCTVGEIQNINRLSPVGNAGIFTDYSAVTKDSAYIIISHPSLWTSANDYKSYREISGYQVELVNIEELYDQFSYGIKKHPLSIRNFMRFAWGIWPTHPSNLFLIGKSIMESGQLFRKDPSVFHDNLVPSYSWPAIDNAFTIALDGFAHVPSLQVGRLAVSQNSEVNIYLNKVMEYETAQNSSIGSGSIDEKLWMKNIIHFGGGGSPSEQLKFKNYLHSYQDTIEGILFGGNVFNFYKTTTDAIDFNQSDSIKSIINNGASLLTFFGHSSAYGFDINLDNAQAYSNQGRYFMLYNNGCFAGDMFQNNNTSISENFILTPEKGAIGFIAQSYTASDVYLNIYAREFYSNLGRRYYNRSISKIMRESARISVQNNLGNTTAYTTAQEMSLHGDPAICLSKNELPDYAVVSPAQIRFSPNEVSTNLDSFDVIITVSNLGMAVDSVVSLELKRIFPDGHDTTYFKVLDSVFYQKEVLFTLPVNGSESSDINTFEVRVDPAGFIDESSESNNNIVSELFISSNEATPIYPYNYAVTGLSNIILSASTNDPFAQSRTYIIQYDTTDSYSSPMKRDTLITQAGGIISWNIHLPITTDSTVYFWRISPYSSNPFDLKWKEHSFQYINNVYGWGQDQFSQFKNNEFTKINYLKNEGKLAFDTSSAGLFCQTMASPTTYPEYDGIRYDLNSVTQLHNLCGGTPAIKVAVFDPFTLEPWVNAYVAFGDTFNFPEHDFGNMNNLSQNCLPNRREEGFTFWVHDQEQMDSLASMLENKIPDGHYILAYSAAGINFFTDTILNNSNVKQAFQNLGSQEIDNAPDLASWIFFVKKGDISTRVETLGTTPTEFVSLSANMDGSGNYGEITSPLIGPARSWTSLYWNYNQQEGVGDTVNIDILGQNDQIIQNFDTWSGNAIDLTSLISANTYPYIKLRARLKDIPFRTPSFSDSWHVVYEEAPESAIDYHSAFLWHADTLDKGDILKFSIPIKNVSTKDMDSLRVLYTYRYSGSNATPISYAKQDSLLRGQTFLDTLNLNTSSMKRGSYIFSMEVNPKDSLWQIEQYHFNNRISKAFYIRADNQNPLLDVTFDGVHILDGDIVAPSPEILVTLRDENKFLLLNEDKDTANFTIKMTLPNDSTETIYFASSEKYIINYQLSTRAKDPFSIQITPKNLSDGMYKLSVQAKDKSGNKSDDIAYVISFEIVNKSTITQVMNYPNPFSTATRFVFTLTGSVIPDVFKIQILTVSGKVVREITQDQLGEIRIGRNISNYVWDGTDEYGDRLANGVYLYRVITKINQQNVELRSTEADQYFHKGFGKMYLMR